MTTKTELAALVDQAHVTLLTILTAARNAKLPIARALLLAIPGATPLLVDVCITESGVEIV